MTAISKIRSAWKKGRRAIAPGTPDLKRFELDSSATKCAEHKDWMKNSNAWPVDAEKLADLIIEMANENNGAPLYMRGFKIVGRLNLEGIAPSPSSTLPALRFIQCYFEDGICIAGARLRGISLRGSRFGLNIKTCSHTDLGKPLIHINANNCRIDGDFDVSHVEPLELPKIPKSKEGGLSEKFSGSEKTRLVFSCGGSEISGDLNFDYSYFSEHADFAIKGSAGKKTGPFSVDSTRVGGNFYLMRSTIQGGGSLRGFICDKEVWFLGSKLDYRMVGEQELPKNREALRFQSVRIGSLIIRPMEKEKAAMQFTGGILLLSGEIKSIFCTDLATNEKLVFACSFIFDSIKTEKLFISGSPNGNSALSNVGVMNCNITALMFLEAFSSKHRIGQSHPRLQITSSELNSVKIEHNGDAQANVIIEVCDVNRGSVHGNYRSVQFKNCNISTECDVSGDLTEISLINCVGSGTYQIVSSNPLTDQKDVMVSKNIDAQETGALTKEFGALTDRDKIEIRISDWCETGESIISHQSGMFAVDLSGSANDVRIGGRFKIIDLSKMDIAGDLDIVEWRTPSLDLLEQDKRAGREEEISIPLLDLNGLQIGKKLAIASEVIDTQPGIRIPLQCFPDYDLYISSRLRKTKDGNGPSRHEQTAMLVHKDSDGKVPKFTHLSGKSSIFHKLNSENYIKLASAEEARQYLILFCNFVWAEEGPFRLINETTFDGDLENTNRNSNSPGLVNVAVSCDDVLLIPARPQSEEESDTEVQPTPAIFREVNIFKTAAEIREFLGRISNNDTKEYDPKPFASFLPKLNELEEKYDFYGAANVVYGDHLFLAIFGIKINDKNSGRAKSPTLESEYISVQMLEDKPIYSLEALEPLKRSVPKNDIIDLKGADNQGSKKSGEEFEKFVSYLHEFGGYRSVGSVRIKHDGRSLIDPNIKNPTFFPINHFGDRIDEKSETLYRAAWGMERQALVDIRNASCSILKDRAGSAWGRNCILLTDRFRFESLDMGKERHLSIDKAGQYSIDEIFDAMVADPEQAYNRNSSNPEEGEAIERQRLRWLCQCWSGKSPYDFDSITPAKGYDTLNFGLFQQIANKYYELGMYDECQYIEEAKNLARAQNNVQKLDEPLKLSKPMMGMFSAASLLLAVLSFFTGMNSWAAWFIAVFIGGLLLLSNPVNEWIIRVPLKAMMKGYNWVSRVAFAYGLSLYRPLMLILFLFSLGWFGTSYMNEKGFLVVEASFASSGVHIESSSTVLVTKELSHEVSSSAVRCGSNVDNMIYALDMMIPLIELDQDERCMLRPHGKDDPSYSELFDFNLMILRFKNCMNEMRDVLDCSVSGPLHPILAHPSTWRFLQSVFVIFSWVSVSITLVIATSLLRRQSRSSAE